MAEIIQLKISLADTKPSIWRRVLVKSSTSLLELHLIFQETMGWEGYHLFEFSKGKQRFGMPDKEFDAGDLIDAGKIRLSAIIAKEKDKFRYTYDFGDSWAHSVVAEKFLPEEKGRKYPVCIDGAMNCPPEDCGGIGGYYHLLDVLANKKHKEHKEMLQWVGGAFNPEQFDLALVNASMEELASE